MKKFLVLIIVCLSLISLNVYADTYQGTLTGDSVYLRKGPGTNYGTITTLAKGSKYTMSTTKKYTDEGGCSAGWYKLDYNGTSGYVCSKYVEIKTIKTADLKDCKTALSKLGFPDSYLEGLCTLQQDHPTWSFVPITTNLDWDYAVKKESECGESYVYTSNSDYIDTSCTNIYAGKVSNLYPASQKAVAYYMDPRNFFNEQQIFQFENLKYSTSLSSSYQAGIKSLLKGANFYDYHVNLGTNFAGTLNKASKAADINPIFYASRMLQELGRGTAEYNLYSGVYKDFKGYYNFINYGVSDSCAVTYGATYCGLTYAKNQGWNSLYNAFYGGANLLTKNYISQNQNTNYLQKFNVVPLNANRIFVHQYMTNIGAPSSEAKSSYSTYKSSGILEQAFVFYIPVYKNMDETIENNDNGGSKEEVEEKTTTVEISTLVTSSGYKYSSKYLTGVKVSTDASSIINAISAVGGKVTIKDASGNKKTSGAVGTGYTVTIKNSDNEETLTIVINGDTNGDGNITAVDLLQVQKALLGTYNLTGAYKDAGDTNNDGNITAVDLLQVQKNLLGTYEIGQ